MTSVACKAAKSGMFLITLLALLVLAVPLLPQHAPTGWTSSTDLPIRPLTLRAHDRVLVLAPHPDDDVLGCGGVIQQALQMHLPVRVCFLTCGDANEWSFLTWSHRMPVTPGAVLAMGGRRHDEAVRGEARLGQPADGLTFLGYPDAGTLAMFTSHWRPSPPYRAVFTRATSVPYRFALRPGAPYVANSVLADLTQVIRNFRPTCIFVSHPLDQNVDHRALYLFTRVVLWHVHLVPKPRLYPYLVHMSGWPKPGGLHPDLDLPVCTAFPGDVCWKVLHLDGPEVAVCERAIRAHQTQMSYSATYLLSFIRRTELFGDLKEVRPGGRSAQPASVATQERAPPSGESYRVEVGTTLSPAPGRRRVDISVEPVRLGGREWRFLRCAHGYLELGLQYARPIALETHAVFHFFGDRSDRPFPRMPHITVSVSPISTRVYDGRKLLPSRTVLVRRTDHETVVGVSLKSLAFPRHVLVSALSSVGGVNLDYDWWATVTMPR